MDFGDRKYYLNIGVHDISPDFRLETGYIPRDGTTTLDLSAQRTFYLEKRLLQKMNVGYWGYIQQDTYFNMGDGLHNFYVRFGMPRTTELDLECAVGSEIFEGKSFDRGSAEVEFTSQILKSLYIVLEIGMQGSPYYDEEENPFQGDVSNQVGFFNFQPTENFSSEFLMVREAFTSRGHGYMMYDYRIYRNKTTYQVNKYLFLRGILDYSHVQYPDYHLHYPEDGEIEDEQGLTGELLLGFTYFPGTVLYLGYGTRRENLEYDGEEYVPVAAFHEMKRGLFFKASYNWRL